MLWGLEPTEVHAFATHKTRHKLSDQARLSQPVIPRVTPRPAAARVHARVLTRQHVVHKRGSRSAHALRQALVHVQARRVGAVLHVDLDLHGHALAHQRVQRAHDRVQQPYKGTHRVAVAQKACGLGAGAKVGAGVGVETLFWNAV